VKTRVNGDLEEPTFRLQLRSFLNVRGVFEALATVGYNPLDSSQGLS
jgi:hypothetical protein